MSDFCVFKLKIVIGIYSLNWISEYIIWRSKRSIPSINEVNWINFWKTLSRKKVFNWFIYSIHKSYNNAPVIKKTKILHRYHNVIQETVCIYILSSLMPLNAWFDSWNSVLFYGFKLMRGTRGLTVNLLKKCLILAKFLFCGWSSSGSSDLSTRGGSLNSIFLESHCFQFYLGSITGSE